MSHRTTSMADGSAGSQRRKVWLLEGGYTSDTRHLQKLAEKKNKHQSLLNALEDRGQIDGFLPLVLAAPSTVNHRRHEPAWSWGKFYHQDFDGNPSAFCNHCSRHHYPMQNSDQTEAHTFTEKATLDAPPPINPPWRAGGVCCPQTP